MNVFRRLSNRGLLVLLSAVAGAAAVAAALAVTAFGGGGATPPPEPLAQALHDAATAPPVDGVTARISFTNHLLGSDALGGLGGGSSPLLGASGRLWATNDGHLRLELQSDAGDAQIVTDGEKLTVYDGTSNTAYELTLPQPGPAGSTDSTPPTLDEITGALASFGEYATLSDAVPDSVAGQPAYTVTATPKDSGGLLGGGEVSWDANTGVPLHVAIDARGSSSPVLDLSVTDISYGSVPSSEVDIAPPSGAKVVTVPTPSGSGSSSGPTAAPVTGLDAVAAAVPFQLVAPDTLNGLARSEVRLVGQGALVTYGEGLGTIVVHEAATTAGESGPLGQLPTVSVGAATGHELVTTLGSVVAFDQGGVSFTVAGSVTQADAESAARALAS
jgi:outer membrane lipoprotein-sorting protein